MLEVFKHVQNSHLSGLIVWVPMVKGDRAIDAAALVSPDKRFAMQAWDARRAVGEELQKTLKLNCPAWDVYLVYKPGVRWEDGDAPAPTFWMHQLGSYAGADPASHLKPEVLEARVKQELDAADGAALSTR